jgi:hypothetical protein
MARRDIHNPAIVDVPAARIGKVGDDSAHGGARGERAGSPGLAGLRPEGPFGPDEVER